jgi:ABC-type uncharacterized transport system permease subunit
MILANGSWLSLLLSTLAGLAYVLPAASAQAMGGRTARQVLTLAWVLHGLLLGWGLMAEAPRFGFAPALSVTAWLALAIYGIESRIYPQLPSRKALWVAAAVGLSTLGLSWLFPGQPLHASASVWLPVHLALGIASYGLFAAAAVHAWLMNRAEAHMRQMTEQAPGLPLLTLERLTFRFVGSGFVLLSATLLSAIVFGESLYGNGTAWRWDHKTVFSLLSWAVFAVLLLGRARFGWRGRRAARLLYGGALLLLLAYVGSRFVLEIVLDRSV